MQIVSPKWVQLAERFVNSKVSRWLTCQYKQSSPLQWYGLPVFRLPLFFKRFSPPLLFSQQFFPLRLSFQPQLSFLPPQSSQLRLSFQLLRSSLLFYRPASQSRLFLQLQCFCQNARFFVHCWAEVLCFLSSLRGWSHHIHLFLRVAVHHQWEVLYLLWSCVLPEFKLDWGYFQYLLIL